METTDISDMKSPYKHQRKIDIITRTLTVILPIVAGIKIIVSLCFLTQCRNTLRDVTNAVGLHHAPCYHLVTPGYIGCVVIFFTIFGLCCLGKRITAILFLILAVSGTAVGVYLFVCKNCTMHSTEITGILNMTVSNCVTPNTVHDKSELSAKWQLIKHTHVTCVKTADWIITKCRHLNTTRKDNSIELPEWKTCRNSLFDFINDTQNYYMLFVFVIILIACVFFLFVSVLLFYLHNATMRLNKLVIQEGEALTELNSTHRQPTQNKNCPSKFQIHVTMKWCLPSVSKTSMRHVSIEDV